MPRQYRREARGLITTEVIRGLSDQDLQYVLFDRICFKAAETNQNAMDFAAAQSTGIRMIFHVTILDGEIGNGGFNQYFFNELDRFVDEQMSGLGLIGADKHQDVLRMAAVISGVEMQNADLQRLYDAHTMESFMATYKITTLGECDRAWYALDGVLTASIVRYVRENVEEFEL